MTMEAGRSWGYWTRAKLEMLADYLAAFAMASKSQSERIYLDAFAGEGTGLDRLTGETFPGSARIALEAGGGAGFTKFRYFEKGQRATELQARLRADYPNRDIKVYEGDCNTTILDALQELRDLRWASTFAFLDPDGMGGEVGLPLYLEAQDGNQAVLWLSPSGAQVPRISSFYGIVITMYFDETHHEGRPHFHAAYGDDDAVFDIERVELIAGRLPRRAQKLVIEWARAHQKELRENWTLARAHKAPKSIDPLL